MEPQHHRQGSRVRFAEEEAEPGLEVVDPGKDAEAGDKAAGKADARAGTAPEVYWADEDNDPESAKYTFYREGTPTPPEEEHRDYEKSGFGGGYGGQARGAVSVMAAAALARAATARASLPLPPNREMDGGSPPFVLGGSDGALSMMDGPDPEPGPRRRTRWIVLTIIALLVAIPIGVGVGLAFGLRNQSTSGASSAAVSSTSSPPTTPLSPNPTTNVSATQAPSASRTSSGGTATPTVVLPTLDCPGANNTLYTVPGSTKTFLHTCGIDYSGAGEATDLSHVYTNSMAECMNVCASFDKCTGCGWGFVTGDTGEAHRCWMKNDLRAAHRARDDYCFGILQS